MLAVVERTVDLETGEIEDWSPVDEAALCEAEARVARGLREAWLGLRDIQAGKLYRKGYSTFEDYCLTRWGISRSRGYQLVAAANLIDAVSTSGVQIPNERVARSLLDVDPERRIPILLAAQSASGGKLTSGYIRSADKVMQDVQATGHVDLGNGTMTPLDAAITVEESERIARLREHNAAAAEKANGVDHDTKVVISNFTVTEALATWDGKAYVTLEVPLDVIDQIKEGATGSGAIYLRKAAQA